MQVLLLGVSHHTAPIDLRERLAFAPDRLPAALGMLAQQPGLGEIVLLSTCNRSETYVTCADAASAREVVSRFLTDYHGVPGETVQPHLYAQTDGDAVRHLFRVAAGLDSLVVGEPQILGQVKQAYAVATEQHCTGALLNRLFHQAFSVGKRVRAETGLADGAVSVSYAALGLARKICGEIKGLTALVLGAGDMAALTARHLQAQEPAELLISSRTASHAAELAAEVGGRVIPWDETDQALAAADIVVSATGAQKPIVTRDRVLRAMRSRRTRPLFIIDIAVPRDVEAEAGEIDQVLVYNIDDLQGIVSENLSKRANEVTRAEAIVREEVDAFLAWSRSRTAIPTVVALRRRFEAIRQAELTRLQPKLSALTPEAKQRVDEVTRLIIEKLLLTPTEQLKALSDRDTVAAYADALNRLFALGPDSGGGAPDDEREDDAAGARLSGTRGGDGSDRGERADRGDRSGRTESSEDASPRRAGAVVRS
jgi:glutamyl-tRNA reductase